MLRRVVTVLLLLGVLIVPAGATGKPIMVDINGEKLEFDVVPQLVGNRTMVPVRKIFEELGATVFWNAKNRTINAYKQGINIQMVVGEKSASKNGEVIQLDVPATIRNSRTLVPVRFVSEALGAEVKWDSETRTVVIATRTQNRPIKFTTKASIIGEATATAEQMTAYLLRNNSAPQISCSALELAQMFLEEGQAEGVRGDIAFAQSIHETGFFKFGGLANHKWNNYSGLGVTGQKDAITGEPLGEKFPSPRIGVRAQIQHLKAYASEEVLNNECVDQRFHLVTRGVAPIVDGLSGFWAVPGYDDNRFNSLEEARVAQATYGDHIIKHLNAILEMPR